MSRCTFSSPGTAREVSCLSRRGLRKPVRGMLKLGKLNFGRSGILNLGRCGILNLGRSGKLNFGRSGKLNFGLSGKLNFGRSGKLNLGRSGMENLGRSGMLGMLMLGRLILRSFVRSLPAWDLMRCILRAAAPGPRSSACCSRCWRRASRDKGRSSRAEEST